MHSFWLGVELSNTVSGAQSAFVEGRQLLETALIANEVIDKARRKVLCNLVLKRDFEKAYDRVNWDLLDRVRTKKGFGQRWHAWMRGCLSNA